MILQSCCARLRKSIGRRAASIVRVKLNGWTHDHLSLKMSTLSDDDEVQIIEPSPPRPKPAAVASSSTQTSSATSHVASYRGRYKNTFRLLSWNIDGLSEAGLVSRAQAVVNEIKKLAPDVVYFQEVVAGNFSVLKNGLEAIGYDFHDGNASALFPYHVAMALRRESVRFLPGNGDLVAFDDSRMGRHLLKLHVELLGVDASLLTSHLESTGDPAACSSRKTQLAEVLLEMSASDAPICVFAGDCNSRDMETSEVMSNILGHNAGTIADAWEATGAKWSTKWTWDMTVNKNLGINKPMKCRFDRLYYKTNSSGSTSSGSSGGGLQPTSFFLVGTNPIAGLGLWPSDHFGICCDFKLPSAAPSSLSSSTAASSSSSSASNSRINSSSYGSVSSGIAGSKSTGHSGGGGEPAAKRART